MAPIVDMSDKHAWDDSLLISSWEDALNEYKVRKLCGGQIVQENVG